MRSLDPSYRERGVEMKAAIAEVDGLEVPTESIERAFAAGITSNLGR